MAPLKPGRAKAFESSMASEIEAAMQREWQSVKGTPLQQGAADRRILFAAIAQGVLRYLQAHADDISTTTEDGDGNHAHELSFSVDTGEGVIGP
jgi:hypothetical protein